MFEKISNFKKMIGFILALILAGCGLFYAGSIYAGQQKEPVITSTTLSNQLIEINELAVTEYNYTKVGSFSDSLKFKGWVVPLTQKYFLITYDGYLKAGIDMKQVHIDIQDQKIILTLPDIEILSHEIDEGSIHVYDESKNIFNQISITDYATFASQQKKIIEEEAIEKGLFSETATKLDKILRQYLEMIPEVAENYTIEIQFQENRKK